MVGPGVDANRVDSTTWSDHADIRPTMLMLLGLKDNYSHEGRALVEDLQGWAQPAAVKKNSSFLPLAQVLKQINAPVGQLGLATLQISTTALESNDTNDSTYTNLENQLLSITSQRNALATQILSLLEGAEFGGQVTNKSTATQLINQAQALINQVK